MSKWNRAMGRGLVLFFLSLFACAAAAQAPTRAASFLWEVSSLTNRAYLFGTIHAGKPDWYPLSQAVERAFDDSQVLVVEADVSNVEGMSKTSASMTYAPPDTLKQHVAAVDYARFQKLLPRYRLTEPQVARMKPFMAVSLLVFSEWARLGYRPDFGVDAYLIQRAKAEVKRIVEIEGLQVQAELMDSLTETENRQAFDGTLTALESGLTDAQITGMVEAWQSGDPQGMLEVARKYNESVPGAAAFEEKFVWGRHESMLKKIDGYLNDSKDHHFIAVGSLHLAGPRGLVEQLRKRGYRVKQL